MYDVNKLGPECKDSAECIAWKSDSVCGYIEYNVLGAKTNGPNQCILNSECGKGVDFFGTGSTAVCPGNPIVAIIIILILLCALCICIYCCCCRKRGGNVTVVTVPGAQQAAPRPQPVPVQ